MDGLTIHPIGICRCREKYSYDVPRQGVLAQDNEGVIELLPGNGYEDGLRELSGFSHLWILFWFHLNDSWHPLIRPPRHRRRKVGVFASRSPYRPNPLGMSCVRLIRVEKNKVVIQGHDLIDGTPVLDIKPYLPYADSFPEASLGWTGEEEQRYYPVVWNPDVEDKLAWLESQGICLKAFLLDQLSAEPLNGRRHRLADLRGEQATIAYRTWRAAFSLCEERVIVSDIRSGYTPENLQSPEDKYQDKDIHRRFLELYGE